MKPSARCALLAAAGLAAALPAPAATQTPVQALVDVAYVTRALWRGAARVEYPVTELALTAAFAVPGGHVSVSGWGLVELHDPDPGQITIGRHLAEVDYAAQYAGRLGPLDLTAGAMRYHLRNPVALGTLPRHFRTTELYGGISWREGPLRRAGLTPSVRLWWDIERVTGAFLESELTLAMPPAPLEQLTLHLGLVGGLSLHQSTEGGRIGYFDRDGVAYAGGHVTATIQVLEAVGLGVNYQIIAPVDEATKRRDPRDPARASGSPWRVVKLWITWRVPGGAR